MSFISSKLWPRENVGDQVVIGQESSASFPDQSSVEVNKSQCISGLLLTPNWELP